MFATLLREGHIRNTEARGDDAHGLFPNHLIELDTCERPSEFWHGVAMSLFGALTLLCLLGIRYPVRMMPLLIFEFVWKAIWVLAAWLPPWLGHTLDPDIGDSFVQIFPGVVIVPLFLPWGYIWRHYVLAPADRWR